MTETIGPMEGMCLKLTSVAMRRLLGPLSMFGPHTTSTDIALVGSKMSVHFD